MLLPMQTLPVQSNSPPRSEDETLPTFYSGADFDPQQSLGRLLRAVLSSIARQVDERMAEHDLTNRQWKPLLMVQNCRCSTAAGLARELEVDSGAMTRMLDRLEGKGFLRRVPSADDRRVVKLELTAQGERALESVPGVLAEVFNRHLRGFSAAEHQALVAMLNRMLVNGHAVRSDRHTLES